MYRGEFAVSEEQVKFYEENGYVQLSNVLGAEEIETLRNALDVAVEDRKRLQENWGPRMDEGYTKVFLQMVNVWERYPAIEEYALSPRIGGIARQLTRAPFVRLWHYHALIKFPKDSKATAWHQDKVYWPMRENAALSCWMALDDVTVEKGCMWFLPGSHKLGPLNPVDLGNPGDADLLQLLPAGKREGARPVVVEMKAGSCTFHNGLTFHYAGPNTTETPRRAMVTIFMPSGTHYTPVEHLIGDRGNLKEGEEFHGPLFPIVARKP
jgi:ectoine hydroxylase-related dioxygenase (phytanoyl-CoA dioxygenase family)